MTASTAPYIDAHCHLADARVAQLDPTWPGQPPVLARAQAAGIGRWIQGGVNPEDWRRQTELTSRYPGRIIPCFGVHPVWVAQSEASVVRQALRELEVRIGEVPALGELGLDFGPKGLPEDADAEAVRSLQKEAFEEQLRLGIRAAKPLVLHVVQAHGEALDGLRKHLAEAGGSYSGIVHSFSGSAEVAREYLRMGFALSISGVVARPGYRQLKQAIAEIPFDRLTLETDAPDQSPEPAEPGHSGRPLNRPENLVQVARAVAELRPESAERLLEKSAENLIRIFHLPKELFISS